MPRRERIDLRVREDEKLGWEAEADQLGLTVSELIRRAVYDYVATHSATLTSAGARKPPSWVVGTQERSG